MSDELNEKPEFLNPIQLPLSYWVLVDRGMMTLEEAKAAWAEEHASGVPFDALR